MGRWDDSKRSQERNKKAEKYLLRYSMFLNKITPKFLKSADYYISKKVQRYVKIVSPTQYMGYMICIMLSVLILAFSEIDRVFDVILHVIILIIALLLRSSFGGGGHKKKKDNQVFI